MRSFLGFEVPLREQERTTIDTMPLLNTLNHTTGAVTGYDSLTDLARAFTPGTDCAYIGLVDPSRDDLTTLTGLFDLHPSPSKTPSRAISALSSNGTATPTT